ncbi:cysteine-rich secretory protein LCCL domain-containing 2-like [Mizuhopecten yessoensis]|uniref:cysteine-rich secretory protein LCCL domain-containing 2-like n=1 Tax=Mizuhopecten yessoensis TaxID=6573 RepID=UPI000B45BFA7|nr:cysteine-rich secretory protein LCCL domain-containing 2-like [Mizuhopecten yessoensis]XP_021361826.1 cysteine-rich secretory protein LCCL domain-containing 2-like [Mizuhopecten yessoensis]XP_021361827.1 cysteine-rich secretory protein LCCL domain-containing 2-like [Mizuhopecten yessoensis]XP_021361828.1 cysteine-rich secretory protein LCCL domain-containing 2-like [Mizuhopecten yessoensis]
MGLYKVNLTHSLTLRLFAADRYKMDALSISLVIVTTLATICGSLQDISRYRGYIQTYHNNLRANERAADMKYMNYDMGLEQRAASWASRCSFRHQMAGFGENLAFVSSTGQAVDDMYSINNAMRNWYGERGLWHGGTGHCGAACHYTQIVWSRTTRLGCALNLCAVLPDGNGRVYRNAKYFVCFYSPMGNWVGEPAFLRGQPCSRCPAGNSCFNGLCVGPESGSRGRRSAEDCHPNNGTTTCH